MRRLAPTPRRARRRATGRRRLQSGTACACGTDLARRAGSGAWRDHVHDYNGAMTASAPRSRCRERGASHAAQRRSAPRAAGFTLIEIMVVIVILGVLAALVVPSVLSRTDDARIVAAKTDLGAI